MTSFTNSCCLAMLAALVLAFSPKQKPSDTDRLKPSMDSLVNAADGFSGVVLVANKGTAVYQGAFGLRDYRTGAPMDTASIFELASISKTFTAAVVLRLVQEGKLGLDDPIERFLGTFPYKGITIRNLLNHTSGLPDYQEVMDQHWDKSRVAGNAECIELLVRYHPDPLFMPGERYAYNNTGYLLLATIAERASGIEFTELMRARFLDPLQMEKTRFRTLQEKSSLPEVAWGFIPDEKGALASADSFPSSNYTIWLGNRKGPGRISSTAADLLKWDQSFYSGNLLDTALIDAAYRPARLLSDSLTAYGFGWELHQVNGRRMVGHSGNNPGYRTLLLRDIEQNRTVILLSNNSFEKLNDLAAGAFRVLDSVLSAGDQ
ncbi:MAG: serine hydrolase domain-containing protein [Bacteroidota bacterium]